MIDCPACGFRVAEGNTAPTRPIAALGGRERRLFAAFNRAIGRVLTHADLAFAIWPDTDSPEGERATVRVYVCRLRKRVAEAGLRIVAEHGIGYRMVRNG